MAKTLGIVRKLDELGRIVIPMEIRRTRQWDTGQPIEILVHGDDIVLREFDQANKKNTTILNIELLSQELDGNERAKFLLDEVLEYVKG